MRSSAKWSAPTIDPLRRAFGARTPLLIHRACGRVVPQTEIANIDPPQATGRSSRGIFTGSAIATRTSPNKGFRRSILPTNVSTMTGEDSHEGSLSISNRSCRLPSKAGSGRTRGDPWRLHLRWGRSRCSLRLRGSSAVAAVGTARQLAPRPSSVLSCGGRSPAFNAASCRPGLLVAFNKQWSRQHQRLQ